MTSTTGTTEPLLIEAAINGATSKRRNPNVPREPAEVTADIRACLDAGAAIVHNHTDDGVLEQATGRHDSAPYREAWEPVLAERPDAILYPTMAGGGRNVRIEDRYTHFVELEAAGILGMAVADAGTVNLAGRRADGSVSTAAHPYENSPADIAWMFAWCREHDLPVHVSLFEPGFLRLVLGHLEAGTLPAKAKLQIYLSGPNMYFGLPATPWGLEAYLTLLGDAPLPWMVGVIGGDVVGSGMAALAIERGGHVRVGLEDFGTTDARRRPASRPTPSSSPRWWRWPQRPGGRSLAGRRHGRSWQARTSAPRRRADQQALELRRIEAAAAHLADEEAEELRVHGSLLGIGTWDRYLGSGRPAPRWPSGRGRARSVCPFIQR